jgi:hypothetical protein
MALGAVNTDGVKRYGWRLPELAKSYGLSRGVLYQEAIEGRLIISKIRGVSIVTETNRQNWEKTFTLLEPKAASEVSEEVSE